jgi:hypothetical protein
MAAIASKHKQMPSLEVHRPVLQNADSEKAVFWSPINRKLPREIAGSHSCPYLLGLDLIRLAEIAASQFQSQNHSTTSIVRWQGNNNLWFYTERLFHRLAPKSHAQTRAVPIVAFYFQR